MTLHLSASLFNTRDLDGIYQGLPDLYPQAMSVRKKRREKRGTSAGQWLSAPCDTRPATHDLSTGPLLPAIEGLLQFGQGNLANPPWFGKIRLGASLTHPTSMMNHKVYLASNGFPPRGTFRVKMRTVAPTCHVLCADRPSPDVLSSAIAVHVEHASLSVGGGWVWSHLPL